MRNKFTIALVLLLLSTAMLRAQSISVLMSPKPSPYISDWRDRTETAKLIITNTSAKDIQVKIKGEIFDGNGARVAFTDAAKVPVLTVPPGVSQYGPEDIIPSNAVSYSGKLAETATRSGRIPDDNYRICVSITDPVTGTPVGTSGTICKNFSILAYQAPVLISPKDKENIPVKQIHGIMFRWSPVTPSPGISVQYKLQIWEVLPGQSEMIAMRANQPILEKDLRNITQTQWPVEFQMPEKGKRYVWTVTPIDDQERNLVDGPYGFAQPFSFMILDDNINTKIDSVHVGCCKDGKQSVYVKISNMHLTNQAQVTAIKYRVNGTGPLTVLSPVSPALPYTLAASSSQAFTGSINCVDSMKTIKFIVDAIWPTDPDNINTETAWDTLHCACDACDEKHFTLNAPLPAQITVSGNSLVFSQPITVITTPAKTIKSIKAELVYFEMTPENSYCLPCNKNAPDYGHFSNGTNSLSWNGSPSLLNITVNIPQLTPCCSALFRWCIRYKIEFTDCTTCSKQVCYEKKKEGCATLDNH